MERAMGETARRRAKQEEHNTAHGITPTFAINAALVDRVPRLIERIASRGNEILGQFSWDDLF